MPIPLRTLLTNGFCDTLAIERASISDDAAGSPCHGRRSRAEAYEPLCFCSARDAGGGRAVGPVMGTNPHSSFVDTALSQGVLLGGC